MRALVTGASGFAGSALVRELLKRGHRVTALCRSEAAAERLRAAGAQPVIGDVRDAASLGPAVADAAVVFHLAAAFRAARLSDAEYRAVNVEGTRSLLEAAARAGVGRFVHCSTVGVYGDTGRTPVSEQAPLRRGDDSYNRSKREGEEVAREFFARRALPGVVLRPTVGYGPGEPRYAKLFRSIQRRRFVMIGSGKTLYNMVYVDDVCDGVIRAGERPEAVGEDFILGGPENVTLSHLVALIADIVGGGVGRVRVPLAPVMLAARACELACKPLGIEPPLHPRRVGFFSVNRAVDIGKARRLLGYSPAVSLRGGLAAMAEWYRAQGML